jgi:hypothetical protein
MKCMIRMVMTTDESNEETREIANLEREDLTPNTLGFTLAGGKAIRIIELSCLGRTEGHRGLPR